MTTADQLIDCLGEIAATRLLSLRGGTRIEIPQRPTGSSLSEIIGADGVGRLIEGFGPGRLQLPTGHCRGSGGRRRQAKRMLREGRSIRDVALALDLHMRTVERFASEIRDDRQIDMEF
ncbi:hypothetical protein [Palleronia caenipelagi]|uniref:Uncharacterized protein n=1 Tax=Palleronia caenipelagi TaxID=2489174 RepID=A0A547PW50_9RHOB|nr:hypothetical protein [Palleronia caenipelagi]TRD18377.1 hypothetical protein FEV53_12025 [Palleronia caenipelagi]